MFAKFRNSFIGISKNKFYDRLRLLLLDVKDCLIRLTNYGHWWAIAATPISFVFIALQP